MEARPMRLSDLYTVPSAITFGRLALAVGMPFWVGGPWILPAYLLAIATDILDGVVARRLGRSTRAGAAFDGWVDKILHVNLGWALAVADQIPDWYVAAWCAREIIQAPLVFVLIHRFRTAKSSPNATSVIGRATAVSLFVAVVLALLHRDALLPTVLAGVLGSASGLHYAVRHLRPLPAPAPPAPGYREGARLSA